MSFRWPAGGCRCGPYDPVFASRESNETRVLGLYAAPDRGEDAIPWPDWCGMGGESVVAGVHSGVSQGFGKVMYYHS